MLLYANVEQGKRSQTKRICDFRMLSETIFGFDGMAYAKMMASQSSLSSFPHMHRVASSRTKDQTTEKNQNQLLCDAQTAKQRQKKHKLDAQQKKSVLEIELQVSRKKPSYFSATMRNVTGRRPPHPARNVHTQLNSEWLRRHISHELKNEMKWQKNGSVSTLGACSSQVVVNRLKWQHEMVRCVHCSR